MPFGLSNTPAVLQAFINDTVQDILNKFVCDYLDDILIITNSPEEHVLHVCLVLQCLLIVTVWKCEFHVPSVSFFGYITGWNQVQREHFKVQAVINWLPPTQQKELQRYLGFANIYRCFIRRFNQVAERLTSHDICQTTYSFIN